MYWPPLYTGHYFFPYIPWTSASQLPKSPLNNWQIAYKTAYFLLQMSRKFIHTACHWSLFLFSFCFIVIFWLCYKFTCYNKHFWSNCRIPRPAIYTCTCVAALWRMRYLTNWTWLCKVSTPFDNKYVSSRWSKCCGLIRCSWVSLQQIYFNKILRRQFLCQKFIDWNLLNIPKL